MLKIFEKPNHNRAFHNCMEHWWAKSNLDIDTWFYKTLKIQWWDDDIGPYILVPDEIAPDYFIKDGPAIPALMKDKVVKRNFQTYWYFLWTYQRRYAQTYHLNIAFDDINNTLHVCRWRDQGYMPANEFLNFIYDQLYDQYGLHATPEKDND